MNIDELFEHSKIIAIVGLSSDQMRSSYSVAMRLLRAGFTIIPINPTITEWEGLKSYPSVSVIPETIQIDIVDVFRREEFLLAIITDSLSRKNLPKCIWLQQNLSSPEGERLCQQKGVSYVEDRCLAVDYGFFLAKKRAER